MRAKNRANHRKRQIDLFTPKGAGNLIQSDLTFVVRYWKMIWGASVLDESAPKLDESQAICNQPKEDSPNESICFVLSEVQR
jgi:hypothetical protein